MTQSVIYPYNNTTTPLKTFANTYLNTSTYTSNYIYNRLASSTMTPGAGSPVTLVTNTYDSSTNCTGYSSACSGWVAPSSGPTREVDSSPPIPVGQRGYLNYSVNPSKSTTLAVYTYGSPAKQWGSDGSTASASADASTNFNAPVTITSQSYTTTMAYNSWLGVTQTTGANGEQMSMTYDSYGRPSYGYSPYCLGGCYSPTVGYSYGTSAPFTQTKSGPDGVTTTTLDGLGRPVLVSRGDTATMCSHRARPSMHRARARRWRRYKRFLSLMCTGLRRLALRTTYTYDRSGASVDGAEAGWRQHNALRVFGQCDDGDRSGGQLEAIHDGRGG